MAFLKFNGWGLRDLIKLIENAGKRDGDDDTNSTLDDPRFMQTAGKEEVSLGEMKALFDKHCLESCGTWDEYQEKEDIVNIAKILTASILQLAKETTHKSVVIIYGRDMYAAQEVLRVLGHKLRGTWIYLEGASRGIVWRNKFTQWFEKEFKNVLEKADVIYGLDTGFMGSVPDGMFNRTESFTSTRSKLQIRLISAGSIRSQHRKLFKDYSYDMQESFFRSIAVKIEDFHKPFLRATELKENGSPIMRIASPKSIMCSAALMWRVREEATSWLPYVPVLLDKDTDVVTEITHIKEWATKRVLQHKENLVIAAIKGDGAKEDCLCGLCIEINRKAIEELKANRPKFEKEMQKVEVTDSTILELMRLFNL